MNFKTLCEMEKTYINFTEDSYLKPRLRFKHRALTIYESAGQSCNVNYFYVFLSDWFICAFHFDGGVGFFNEAELKKEFDKT